MNFAHLRPYIFPILLFLFLALRFFKFRFAKSKVSELLSQGGVIIDVRSRSEFASGSSKGSLNIPLDELDVHITQLDSKKPVILCCASGARAEMAASLLRRKGFKTVVNAGSWKNTAPRPQ